jgi:hypothetical protein
MIRACFTSLTPSNICATSPLFFNFDSLLKLLPSLHFNARLSTEQTPYKKTRGAFNIPEILNLYDINSSVGALFYKSNLVENFFTSVDNNPRSLTFDNANILYKIKIGNFLPDELYSSNFSFLHTSLNFKSVTGLQADWFLTDNLKSVLSNPAVNSKNPFDYLSYLNFNTQTSTLSESLFSVQDNFKVNGEALKFLLFSQTKQTRVLNN